jgi:hypothetical protein
MSGEGGKRRSGPALLVGAWSVLALAGCGGASLAPVEGVVTLDGRPLSGATVSIVPKRATDPGPFFGTTDADGRFALGPANHEGGGAKPGVYGLMITTVKPAPGVDEVKAATMKKQQEIVPEMYRDGSLDFEVMPDGTKEAKFALVSR